MKRRPKKRVVTVKASELQAIRRDLESSLKQGTTGRWNPDKDDVQRSVAKLVLTLVEFIRRLLERQAIRRLENKTLSKREIEDVGQALMQLEKTVAQMAEKFGVSPEELNLELGPLGKLM